MCGLVGFIRPKPGLPLVETAERMAGALIHRGPDSSGVWADELAGVALAHRRLSVLELSPAGHQPMASASSRYVIVFNGEIYNHAELRADLAALGAAPTWRGHSDTESLLAAIERWGVEAALNKVVGMFAIALWDRERRELILARDRFGEKPLYYGWSGGTLLFASEVKALRAFPGFDNPLDRGALALYMRHNYVPAPWSIYRDVWKLAGGCFVRFRLDGSFPGQGRGEITTYWSAREAAAEGLRKPFSGTEAEALDELDRLLRQAVAGQMVADVPLGAFLSGGIDSSTIVALMQEQSRRPVRTFTIGFHEGEYNEATHARAVATHLGSEHTELYVTPDQALGVIPQLAAMYDEPFADSSQLPTYLVSALARQHVTVALSGDGGDELFGGYNRYFWAAALWRKLRLMPRGLRAASATSIRGLPPRHWNRLFKSFALVIPARLRYSNPGDKLHKLAGLLSVNSPEELYLRLVSHWDSPASLVLGAEELPTPITDPSSWLEGADFTQGMMLLDSVSYLPDDILVKVDRAAMSVSLETRVPLLDHRVMEFAWRLPGEMKIRNGQGKWLLRKLLHRYVPAALVERPKMGFGVPIDEWLRGPLRAWANDLLAEDKLRREGIFDPAPIREKWLEHLSGRRNWQYLLWDVLMFQSWKDSAG